MTNPVLEYRVTSMGISKTHSSCELSNNIWKHELDFSRLAKAMQGDSNHFEHSNRFRAPFGLIADYC